MNKKWQWPAALMMVLGGIGACVGELRAQQTVSGVVHDNTPTGKICTANTVTVDAYCMDGVTPASSTHLTIMKKDGSFSITLDLLGVNCPMGATQVKLTFTRTTCTPQVISTQTFNVGASNQQVGVPTCPMGVGPPPPPEMLGFFPPPTAEAPACMCACQPISCRRRLLHRARGCR